jgi:hemerythrin
MSFKLEPEMLSGIDQIDNQHLQVVKDINNFILGYDNCSEEEEKKFITAMYERLSSHFASEDKLLKVTNYDKKECKRHTKEHKQILSILKKMNNHSALSIVLFTIGRIVSHVENFDVLYFDHVRSLSKEDWNKVNL